MIAELDRHGASARALAYHLHAEEFSPVRGNQLLEAWLGADDRLVPLWATLPTDELLVQLAALRRAGRLRAARLVATHALPLAGWTYGELLGWLAQAGVPLWIALPDVDARDLVATLREIPQLRVVLAGAHYSDTLLAQERSWPRCRAYRSN